MMAGDRTYSCTYRTYSAQALSAPPSMSAIVSVTKWSQAAAARCLPFGTKVPAGPDWFREIKHDGYRLIVQREGKRVRLLTRRGYDWSDRYPLIVEAALRLRKTSFIIDGEAVVLGPDGVSDFDALHGGKRHADVRLYAFDLLADDGVDMRHQPLQIRKNTGRAPQHPRRPCVRAV